MYTYFSSRSWVGAQEFAKQKPAVSIPLAVQILYESNRRHHLLTSVVTVQTNSYLQKTVSCLYFRVSYLNQMPPTHPSTHTHTFPTFLSALKLGKKGKNPHSFFFLFFFGLSIQPKPFVEHMNSPH